ncbi:flagellar hook-associated protein FlgL [Alteromonas ponticola]|uniref:Flagellar hook-associated protein FlgL n=1 Tax=Alteromonas aquimaris TaxID=2998417 RepID=A0ABT3P4A3_9ALTE|nr:flagellar hook-associated protein FlgL [Alteromonas aquimaris]MCW8107584.1 flagellar hook-associated protein FlgL [Alteromonas aquimaris]
MRISTNQFFNRNLDAIMDSQRKLADTQEQLSTGKRINRPSDDPVGAAQVVRLTEQLANIDQYKKNNGLFISRLEQQETVLSNINDAAGRARQLIQQAGSGVLNDADRRAIGSEIQQIRDEVLDLMNAKDPSGDYMFAGFQADSPAFSFNPAATGKAVRFEGDSGTNSVKLSDSVTLRNTTSGQDVFENVIAPQGFSVTGSAGATVDKSDVANQDAFDSFFNANYDGFTAANNDFRLTLQAGNQVQLTNVASGAVIDTVDYTAGEPFTIQGMSFTVSGAAGDTVDFSLNKPEKKNIAETLHDIYTALAVDGVSGDTLRKSIQGAISSIDSATDKISAEVSSIGGRQNVATAVFETNLDLEVNVRSARANIEETDFAEASAEFARQETALNAALQTFPRISSLSLFNFI